MGWYISIYEHYGLFYSTKCLECLAPVYLLLINLFLFCFISCFGYIFCYSTITVVKTTVDHRMCKNLQCLAAA